MDAPQYTQWLHKKLGKTPELPKARKRGQRKNKLYQMFLQTMGLQDCEKTFDFYQNLTEAISAFGLCIFTVVASVAELSPEILSEPIPDRSSIYPVRLLHYIAGFDISFGKFLSTGAQSCKLQKELQYHIPTE